MADRDHSRTPRGNGLSTTTDEIMRLVVQREQARLQKDWGQADSFRDRLGAVGVNLLDKENRWKATDGRTGRIPSFSEVENGAGNPDAVIALMGEKGGAQAPVHSMDSEEGRIKNLVQEREQARAAKDYARSDQIREELKGMGVELFDKDKIWKSSSGLCGVVIGYNAGGGSGPSPTDTEISILMQQREKARQTSDWPMADMIRDELKTWGVDIFDKDKVWRCSDGRSGNVPQWANAMGGAPQMAGQMVPAYHMQPLVPHHHLDQLIGACVANAQNPATSARTMALLQQAAQTMAPPPPQHYGYPPQHQQHRQPPRSGAPTQRLPPPGPPKKGSGGGSNMEMDDALRFSRERKNSKRRIEDHEIMWLVEVREKCRRDKDYAGADNLRNSFRENLGLEISEKDKLWSMNDGRRGEIPAWSTLGF